MKSTFGPILIPAIAVLALAGGCATPRPAPPVVLSNGSLLCPRHPESEARYRCTHCHEVMCESCVHRIGRRGLGSAYIEGFRAALIRGADLIGQMDSDFSHSPDYLPRFLEKIPEYDVIVGSRYVPGGKTDDKWSAWRFVLSWWGNNYARWILGLQVRDSTAGFKLFRRRTLESIDIDHIRSNGYVFQVEVAYLCEKNGMRILEWPIYFEDRRIGKSKMSMRVKLEAAWRVWQIRMRYGGMPQNKARVEFMQDPV